LAAAIANVPNATLSAPNTGSEANDFGATFALSAGFGLLGLFPKQLKAAPATQLVHDHGLQVAGGAAVYSAYIAASVVTKPAVDLARKAADGLLREPLQNAVRATVHGASSAVDSGVRTGVSALSTGVDRTVQYLSERVNAANAARRRHLPPSDIEMNSTNGQEEV
jgi:hypothetical protein